MRFFILYCSFALIVDPLFAINSSKEIFLGISTSTWSAIGAIVSAIASIVLTCVTYKYVQLTNELSTTNKNQLDEQKRNFDISRRPYLSFQGIKLDRIIAGIDQDIFSISIDLKNSGISPLKYMLVDFKSDIKNDEDHTRFSQYESYLFPGDSTNYQIARLTIPFSRMNPSGNVDIGIEYCFDSSSLENNNVYRSERKFIFSINLISGSTDWRNRGAKEHEIDYTRSSFYQSGLQDKLSN